MFKNLFSSNTNEENELLEPTIHSRLANNDLEQNESTSPSFLSRFNSYIPFQNEENSSENEPFFPSLSYQTRFLGFVSCFLAGFLLSSFSTFTLMTGSIVRFCFIYTVGNLVALIGTFFLMGPDRQMKSMFDETRLVSSITYICSLILTIFFALRGSSVLVVFPLLVTQWSASVWYSASFVPYGRATILGCLRRATS